MTGVVVFLIVLALAFIVLAVTVLVWATNRSRFRGDSRNPYRRLCRRCGQCQEQHEWNTAPGQRGVTWWENMLPVPDEDCACHNNFDVR